MTRTLDDLREELASARETLARLIREHGYTVDMWRDYIQRLEMKIKAEEITNAERPGDETPL